MKSLKIPKGHSSAANRREDRQYNDQSLKIPKDRQYIMYKNSHASMLFSKLLYIKSCDVIGH